MLSDVVYSNKNKEELQKYLNSHQDILMAVWLIGKVDGLNDRLKAI